jgi:hypothetical protein
LIYPQILRGATSIMAVFVVPFAVKHLATPPTFGAHMALMGQVGLVVGSLLVALWRDRFGSGLVVFLGDTMVGLGFGFLVVTHHWMAVLPVYALITIGNNIESSAVPLGTFTIIPVEIMGAFSGVRMTVLGVSSAIAAQVGGHLFDYVNPLVVFAAVAALKLVNGLWFWWVFTAYRPAATANAGAGAPSR